MDGWLISWMRAGKDFKDRVVSFLPSEFTEDVVERIAIEFWCSATLNFSEVLAVRSGTGPCPQVHRSTNASGGVRIAVEGAWTLEARRVRDFKAAMAGEIEELSWMDQNFDGRWVQASFRRPGRCGVIFELE